MRLNIFFSFPIFFLLIAVAYFTVRPSASAVPESQMKVMKTFDQIKSKAPQSGPAKLRSGAIKRPGDNRLADPRVFLVDQVLRNHQSEWADEEIRALSEHIVHEADNVGIPTSLLLAVIGVESNFDPCAVSPVGAKGLMQVMPQRILGREKAALDFAFNHHLVYDPYWNISFGAAYLQELIDRFGSLEMALSAYNRGPTRLSRQLKNRTFRGCGYTRKVFALQEAFEQHTI